MKTYFDYEKSTVFNLCFSNSNSYTLLSAEGNLVSTCFIHACMPI